MFGSSIDSTGLRLIMLTAMARLLRSEEVRQKLMTAKTAEEFAAVLAEDPEAV